MHIRSGTHTAGASEHDRIADPWGTRTPYGPGQPWPERVDMFLAEGVREDMVERWVPTASVLHSNGDAMDIAVHEGRIVGVRGRAGDRVNRGRLGPRDLFGWQANNSSDRLTLEEYYALTVLARGGIGTNHLDGNTRLCTATAGEALKESFGSDGQPGSYSDVDHADVIALYGHNVAETRPCCGRACSIACAARIRPPSSASTPAPRRSPARPPSIWRRARAPT
ncbi:molybdopterin-dependent oxidoreductase [Nocardia sp. MDA0666]|uniref:molybdopterin-dependent oxidoreductase n=1 Tax=Nocardia sp. MDA0666 TaxID=2135448 RepID=UPI0026D68437